MNALLRTAFPSPADETERLIEAMLESHREPPPGVLVGNADIEASCAWVPTKVTPGTTPVPGREHLLGTDLDLIGSAS